MQASASRGSVLHTALWRDDDLERLRLRGIKRPRKEISGDRCLTSKNFPFTGGCSFLREGSRHEHSEAFTESQCTSGNDPQHFGKHNKLQSANMAFELDNKSQGNGEQELRFSPDLRDQRKRANLPTNIAADDSNPVSATYIAENALFSHFGVTKNEHGYLRDYFYGATLTRAIEHRSDAHSSSGRERTCPKFRSESHFYQEKAEDIRQYQNEIWQSLNEWLEYMYPDACRTQY